MPLYEYQCTRCGQRVEKIQSFSAEPLTICESCGGPLEKLISAPAIQFKGSGWYVTDYASKAGSAASNGKSSGDNKTETKSETAPAKSEAKPESKPTSSE